MADRTYRFFTCDVFTQRRFGGNPLAVVLDAQGIGAGEMQSIAREFNFSETTFVLPPRDARSAARVRIFTPGGELPFAGHPTVGTAFVLASVGRVPMMQTDIVLEENIGAVPVRIDRIGERVVRCTLTSPQLPAQGSAAPAHDVLTRMLSLTPIEVHDAAEWWSCGVPFLVVPLRSVDALARCRLDLDVWASALADHTSRKIYPIARADENTWRVRMFAPGVGVPEDPATGSAAAALAGWIARRQPQADGTSRFVIRQGEEIGRPSEIALAIDQREGKVTAVRVGGSTVMMSDGTLRL